MKNTDDPYAVGDSRAAYKNFLLDATLRRRMSVPDAILLYCERFDIPKHFVVRRAEKLEFNALHAALANLESFHPDGDISDLLDDLHQYAGNRPDDFTIESLIR